MRPSMTSHKQFGDKDRGYADRPTSPDWEKSIAGPEQEEPLEEEEEDDDEEEEEEEDEDIKNISIEIPPIQVAMYSTPHTPSEQEPIKVPLKEKAESMYNQEDIENKIDLLDTEISKYEALLEKVEQADREREASLLNQPSLEPLSNKQFMDKDQAEFDVFYAQLLAENRAKASVKF